MRSLLVRSLLVLGGQFAVVLGGGFALTFPHALLLALDLLMIMAETPVSLLALLGKCRTLRHPCPPFFSVKGAASVASDNLPGSRVWR